MDNQFAPGVTFDAGHKDFLFTENATLCPK